MTAACRSRSIHTMGTFLALLFCAVMLMACPAGGPGSGPDGGPGEAAGTAAVEMITVNDMHSFGRPGDVRVTHADIDWVIDFDAREIRGQVTWTIQRATDAAGKPLILDTRDLTIEEITTEDGTAIPYDFPHDHPAFGRALSIQVPGDETRVVIRYRTSPEAGALQWLKPEQTAGGEKPYLFSQAQAILARTMLPCQDSPAVRVTYNARVRVPEGLNAVMAARQDPEPQRVGDLMAFDFEMPQPIPSYLIAIAVGDIAFKSMGPRSGVYAEPSIVEKAAWEFADTEAMIDATEKMYGPYRWERYDILVLPPSFPFGGMENPRLTFATPTVLAGDRSLTSLIAHELAHSWSGNLVTNATWADFWLNEGFTTYLERRILEEVYGKKRSDMISVLGKQNLLVDMKEMLEEDPGFTTLYNASLEGRDPDDAFSRVPYEKGFLFLSLLERETGREQIDLFLRRWFDENAFTSRTTADFEQAIRAELFGGDDARVEAVKVREWLYEPGLPDNAPEPQSDAFVLAEAEARAFLDGSKPAAELPGGEWSTQEWQHFIRALPDDLDAVRMGELDAAWSLSAIGNSEILFEWLKKTIRAGYQPAAPALEKFLTEQGRRKFLKPLYTEMAKTAQGKQRALEIYRRARSLYHPVSTRSLDEVLEYAG
ncbi:MAG: M1 family metallopeptidase [Acidobacteria bacterium]|nr:M1 family metallopeptidase [Acidobacteriota bacterium]